MAAHSHRRHRKRSESVLHGRWMGVARSFSKRPRCRLAASQARITHIGDALETRLCGESFHGTAQELGVKRTQVGPIATHRCFERRAPPAGDTPGHGLFRLERPPGQRVPLYCGCRGQKLLATILGEALSGTVSSRVAVVMALAIALGAPGAVDARPKSPKVLTLEVADSPSVAYAFARNVGRVSKGALYIDVHVLAELAPPRADGEIVVIRHVEQGTVPLGWIPTRAWDAVGLSGFAALQAPFLITDYALLRKVLAGPVGRSMLAGTRASGVRTLALAAVDLHMPLGARRPFVGLGDFRGATLRVPSNSALTAAILDAVGGKAVSITSGPDLRAALSSGTVDGAISAFAPIWNNGYWGVAKYVTVNLVFFPVVASAVINEQAFQALTPAERALLTKAAVETTRTSFIGIRARDQQHLNILCRTGLKVARSTNAQLTALRRAVQPVYATLRTSRATAVQIAKIQILKKKTRPSQSVDIPKGCAT
jgi:C4-dicarboxylate-binding protein DctP